MEDFGRVERDAWMTSKSTAELCCKNFLKDYPELKNKLWVEPSAGTGNFIEAARKCGVENVKGFDVEPHHDDVVKQNFFSFSPLFDDFFKGSVVFGNPPYGKRQKMSIDFIRHAFHLGADYVAFLLPASTVAFSYLKKIDYKLDRVYILQDKGFKTVDGGKLGKVIGDGFMGFFVFKNENLEPIVNEVISTVVHNNSLVQPVWDVAFGYNKKIYNDGTDYDWKESVSNSDWNSGRILGTKDNRVNVRLHTILNKELWDEDLYLLLRKFYLTHQVSADTYNYWVDKKNRITFIKQD